MAGGNNTLCPPAPGLEKEAPNRHASRHCSRCCLAEAGANIFPQQTTWCGKSLHYQQCTQHVGSPWWLCETPLLFSVGCVSVCLNRGQRMYVASCLITISAYSLVAGLLTRSSTSGQEAPATPLSVFHSAGVTQEHILCN